MGFLKKLISIPVLIISAIISACTQPIVFRNMSANLPGYYMFGKEPAREFYVKENLGDTLKLKWNAETSGSQYSTSVTIYNDIVFVTDLSGKLFAFNRENGKQFGYEKFSGAIPSAPVVSSLRLFFMVNNKEETYSTLTCFDFLSGKIMSESEIPGNVNNEIVKVNDAVIILSDDGIVYKYNLSGFRVWEKNTGSIARTIPACSSDNIYLVNQNGEFISLDLENGNENFRVKISGGFESGITVDGTSAYAGDNAGIIYCMNTKNGSVRWKYDTGSKIKSIPVYNEEYIYAGNLSGRVICLDKFSGKEIWKLETGGIINTTPLLLEDYLLQPNVNKHLDFIDAKSGRLAKRMGFDTRVKMSPVYYDGILYLGTDRGNISAYSKAGKETE